MREKEDGVKHDFHPQLCPQELLPMVFFFHWADKSTRGRTSLSHILPSKLHPAYFSSLSDISTFSHHPLILTHFFHPFSLILQVFTYLRLPSSACPSTGPHTASCRYCASLSSSSDSQSVTLHL